MSAVLNDSEFTRFALEYELLAAQAARLAIELEASEVVRARVEDRLLETLGHAPVAAKAEARADAPATTPATRGKR